VSVESCTNTIARPSGDQSGARWLNSPLVSCFGSPPPDGTRYRWLGRRVSRGGTSPRSSSTNGNEVYTRPSNRLGSGPRVIALGETRLRHESFFVLSGSAPRQLYNSHLPSPENDGNAWTPRTWNASPPGAQVRRNHTSSSKPSRLLVKASSEPSGDQTGLDASVAGLV